MLLSWLQHFGQQGVATNRGGAIQGCTVCTSVRPTSEAAQRSDGILDIMLVRTESIIEKMRVHYRFWPQSACLGRRLGWVLKSLLSGLNLNKHPPFPFITRMKWLALCNCNTYSCQVLISQWCLKFSLSPSKSAFPYVILLTRTVSWLMGYLSYN